MTPYDAFIARKQREYGERFDPSELAPAFVPYFNSNARIEVTTDYSDEPYIRRGRVGVTSGWRPAFLLMHRVSDHGSGDVLREGDRVTRIVSY